MRLLVLGHQITRILIITFALLAVSGAGIFAIFEHDLSAARAGLAGRSKTIDTSLGTVEYAMVGEGEPLLTIHGAGGGFDQAIDMTGALAARGYRLIAPSRFGYLASTSPANPTTAMQADVYAELLDKMGIHKVIVLGISAGEWSALQFAIRHPDRCRALVLIVPANYLPRSERNYGGPFVRLMIGSNFIAWASLKFMALMPGAMTKMMLGTPPALVRAAEPSERLRLQTVLDHLLPVSSRLRGMQFDIKTARTPEPYALERITCPLLAISAEDDLFGTAARAQYLATHVRHGTAVVYPTGGHAMVGRQGELLRLITSFLDRSPQATVSAYE